MYFKKEKYWKCFGEDTLAVYHGDAQFLRRFLKQATLSKSYLKSYEVVDVQKYRLVKSQRKVAALLKLKPAEQYFIFPVNLN